MSILTKIYEHTHVLSSVVRSSGAGSRAVFDFRTDTPLKTEIEIVSANSVLLFDGVFLLRSELRQYFDYSVLVQADFEVTIKRAEQRDLHLFGSIEEVRLRYRERYIPANGGI